MQPITQPTLKAGYVVRPPTLDDVAEVVDLMNACAIKVIGKADDNLDDTRAAWEAAGVKLDTDQRVVIAPDDRIIGYIQVETDNRPTAPFLDLYMHPDNWGDPVEDYLMAWGEGRVREALSNPDVPADARIVVQAATYDNDTYYKGILENAGMGICRVMWLMQIDFDGEPPAPEWPSGITVRTVAPDEDLRPILHARRDAWKDHWGYEETPFDEHYARWIGDWGNGDFDRSLWFLAMDGDQIAGICLCKPHHGEDEDIGWVGTLGVTRPYRKQGLGMALLQHSFGEFYRRGKPRAGLGVDAGSITGATRLYQRAGMRVMTQIDVYEKELRPGVNYRTGN